MWICDDICLSSFVRWEVWHSVLPKELALVRDSVKQCFSIFWAYGTNVICNGFQLKMTRYWIAVFRFSRAGSVDDFRCKWGVLWGKLYMCHHVFVLWPCHIVVYWLAIALTIKRWRKLFFTMLMSSLYGLWCRENCRCWS